MQRLEVLKNLPGCLLKNPMARHFFISEENIQGKKALLDPLETHHLVAVMRKKIGDSIQLLTGKGKSYQGKIVQIHPQVEIDILSSHLQEEASAPLLTLCPALLKNAKMDWMIEKACELGVQTILPFEAEHCVVKSNPEDAKKILRWEKISQESIKQSGRGLLPQIGPLLSLKQLLDKFQNRDCLKLMFTLENIQSLKLNELKKYIQQKGDCTEWVFLIGPEGGFSPLEEKRAQEAGFQLCSLGVYTLRAETSALSVLSILNYLKESMK